MRFKASIRDIHTFTRLTASLNSLGREVWLQLDNDQLRFTVVPEQGSQVWAVLAIHSIFEDYSIQSASPNNVINLRVPLVHLHRALRSALTATSVSIRLTKKDDIPLLSITISVNKFAQTLRPAGAYHQGRATHGNLVSETTILPTSGVQRHNLYTAESDDLPHKLARPFGGDRETTITQNIPIQVLPPAEVAHIHEPVCPEPDIHVLLPPNVFSQIRQISDRFSRLVHTSSSNSLAITPMGGPLDDAPRFEPSTAPASRAANITSRLILSANAEGAFRIQAETSALKIQSQWTNLENPDLDPTQADGGIESIAKHASTLAKERAARGEQTWAEVRVEGRDWSKVTSVGRLGGRVIACFCHDHALILYVYLQDPSRASSLDRDAEEAETQSVLTYYITSYSA